MFWGILIGGVLFFIAVKLYSAGLCDGLCNALKPITDRLPFFNNPKTRSSSSTPPLAGADAYARYGGSTGGMAPPLTITPGASSM